LEDAEVGSLRGLENRSNLDGLIVRCYHLPPPNIENMNTDYAYEHGVVIVPGDAKKAHQMSKWCKERNLVYDVDYKWHCRRHTDNINGYEPVNEIVLMFKDPKQATIARLVWI